MSDKRTDEPLPATARFLIGLGIFLVVVWGLMWVLMTSRW